MAVESSSDSVPGGTWFGVAGCALFVSVAVALAPMGSFPVGYDAFWNLLVAAKWGDGGLPAEMPEAAFTDLATAYGDRQLLFHGSIAALTGGRPSPEAVPPLLWGFALALAVVLWGSIARCSGAGRAGAGVWLFAVPALSQTWMFRTAALRDMLLGILFLVPLVALASVHEDRRPRRRGVALAGLAAGFGYSHGAVVLPVVIWVFAAAGHRLDRGRWAWADGAWILAGTAFACVARPDIPAIFQVLATLNFGMPYANLRAEIGVLPSEFAPYPLDVLLMVEAPFLVGLAVLAWTCWRGRLSWSLAMPVLFMGVSALLSRRMFEIAAPLTALALGSAWARSMGPRHRWGLAVAAVGIALGLHLPRALEGAETNRATTLPVVTEWIAKRAAAGSTDPAVASDLVFVTDWGTTSPLAWFGRRAGLRGTGAIDPILMWAHSPDLWRAWRAIVDRTDPTPLETIRSAFGARFVAFRMSDTSPGAPPGATGQHLFLRAKAWSDAGRPILPFRTLRQLDDGSQALDWIVLDLAP